MIKLQKKFNLKNPPKKINNNQMNRNQIWQGKKLEDKIIEKNPTMKINSNKTNNN
jgi:hypothetical protein